MRLTMLLFGFLAIAAGLFVWFIFGVLIWPATAAVALVNFVLGLVTPKSRKVELQPNSSGTVKLVVDKARYTSGKRRLAFTNYELIFLSDKLVLKKLYSSKLTVVAVVPFFFIGALTASLIGGLVYSLTSVSVLEFLEQRKRDMMWSKNELTTVSTGDLEIPYDMMSQVQLTGAGLTMNVGGRTIILDLAAGYSDRMSKMLRDLIPAESWTKGFSL